MLRQLSTVLAVLAQTSYSKVFEVNDTLPTSPIPYVIRHLDGPKLLLADDVFRSLTDIATTSTGSNNTAADGFGMLLTNGKPNQAVPPHYVRVLGVDGEDYVLITQQHVHWHETFLSMTGTVRVWLNGQPKDLNAGDFAMVPMFQNHSYQFVAQETEFLGLITPAGFDGFFANFSQPWYPQHNVPFPPDGGLPFPTEAFQAATKPFDIQPINQTYAEPDCVNATWHTSNSSLPNDAKTPYFLANGEGPHYWHESNGAVVSPLATSVQTGGNFTIAQIVMRKTGGNSTQSWTSADHQFIYGMAGEVTVDLAGEKLKLIQGDALFIPAYHNFTLSSSVNYNKFLLCTGGPDGVDTQMIRSGKTWGYSTPPAH